MENTFDLFSVHMTSYFPPRNRSVSHSISRSPKIFLHTHLGADRVFALGIGVLFRKRFICWHSVTRRYHTWAVLDDFNASFTYENRQSPEIKLSQPILVHEMTSTRVQMGCNLWTGFFLRCRTLRSRARREWSGEKKGPFLGYYQCNSSRDLKLRLHVKLL